MPRSLVTGAGKRLGRAMALYLAERGHDVAVHYADSSAEADAVVREIRASGQNAVSLQANLLEETEARSLVPFAAQRLGGAINCLVNNASIFDEDTIHSATTETWERNIGSNLRAPFILTQAMASQGLAPETDDTGEPCSAGLIVNMIDQRVRKLTPDYMTYTIAKMGLWALTQTSAQALAPAIRVNAIGPGPTLRASGQTEKGFASQRSATVLERGPNPSDIVAALAYFLDAPAVTGQLLCVDGGQHLGWQTPDTMDVE